MIFHEFSKKKKFQWNQTNSNHRMQEQGSNTFFIQLTFARSFGRYLNEAACGLLFKQLPKDLSKVNAWKYVWFQYYKWKLRHSMTKSTNWPVCPKSTQISLGIGRVWSESSLSTWRHWVFSYPFSAQWRLRSDWVFAGHTGHFAGFVVQQLKWNKVSVLRQTYAEKNATFMFYSWIKKFKF